jgi:dihydrofolate reductase
MAWYEEFYARVGTVILGQRTYDQLVTELSPEEWPYEGKETLVHTSTPLPPKESLHPKLSVDKEELAKLRDSADKDLWLVGGAHLLNAFLEEDLVDELILTVIPELLGEGIPLFLPGFPAKIFDLQSVRWADHLVELHYVRP